MPLLMHDSEYQKLWDWRCRLALLQSEWMGEKRREAEDVKNEGPVQTEAEAET